MTELLRSELLKIRTTRAALGLLLALLGIAGLAVAGTVVSTSETEGAFTTNWADTITGIAGVSIVFALLFGILLATGEYRYGTITWTFLAEPRRGRVVVAKLLVAAASGAALAGATTLVATAIALPWLSARGFSVDSGQYARNAAGVIAAALLLGAMGVGIGTLVRNQAFAIVAALLWFLLVEHLVAAAFSGIARYLPQRAVDALVSGGGGDQLPRLAGGAVAVAWVAALAAAGYALTTRRDVT